jgi:hypothetical protein
MEYKVEAKGSLWWVKLSNGAYSSYQENVYIFSGNSQEEIWEFVKIWAKQGGFDSGLLMLGLEWNDRKYQYKEMPDWYDEMDWDHAYGNSYKVDIERVTVIYVNPTKLLEDSKD